jgi:hypothetical protein
MSRSWRPLTLPPKDICTETLACVTRNYTTAVASSRGIPKICSVRCWGCTQIVHCLYSRGTKNHWPKKKPWP